MSHWDFTLDTALLIHAGGVKVNAVLSMCINIKLSFYAVFNEEDQTSIKKTLRNKETSLHPRNYSSQCPPE